MGTIPTYDFSGCRALVTGGSRGIGRTIVNDLLAAGTAVEVFDVVEPPEGAMAPFRYSHVDIADAGSVTAAVAALPAPVTLLVNNAGITRDRTLAKMSDADWASVLNVNLTGAFNVVRAVVPAMTAKGKGRIVNITSINGLRGKYGQANYAAAKAGLIGLTKTAARELGRKNITVNAVAPGMVMTEMARQLPAEIVDRARQEAALNELAEPEDISRVVMFLLSDAAQAITGEVIKVDAGQYI